jgi:FkbM family methyltransferase
MWEPQVTEYISQKIEKGMTVLDIGADIGYYTLLFAKRVSKNGRVIAFEPIPSAREKLLQNVKMNGYKHITVCDFALFSSNGSATLEGPLKISRIAPKREKKLKNDIEVQTRIFDECLQDLRINRIDIVKIDVEGAELDVLHGMKLSLSKYQPSVLVEIHPEGLKTFGYTSSDLFEFMESMGYRPHPISGTSDYPERETHVFFYKDFRYKNPV